MNMKIVSWLLLITAELVSLEDIDHPHYWKIVNRRMDGNEVAFDPSPEVRAWQDEFFAEDTGGK